MVREYIKRWDTVRNINAVIPSWDITIKRVSLLIRSNLC